MIGQTISEWLSKKSELRRSGVVTVVNKRRRRKRVASQANTITVLHVDDRFKDWRIVDKHTMLKVLIITRSRYDCDYFQMSRVLYYSEIS